MEETLGPLGAYWRTTKRGLGWRRGPGGPWAVSRLKTSFCVLYYRKTGEEVAHDLAFDEHGADRAWVILEKE